MAEKKGDSISPDLLFASFRPAWGRTDAQNEIAPSAHGELWALRLQRTTAWTAIMPQIQGL